MRPECQVACARYRLALPASPLSGRMGDRLGRGSGSSLEFMDYRDYAPGDDPRHVDWRAYARTDQLKVRLFRDEVSPSLDLILDLSPSMASTPAKERALHDLAGAVSWWTRRAGGVPRVLAAGGGVSTEEAPIAGKQEDGLVPVVPLRARGLRMLVSDFLFPHDPAPAIRRLAAGAAHLYVLQLLDPSELDPDPSGLSTLVDIETGARLDLDVNARAIAAYEPRLASLSDPVRRAVEGVAGSYALARAAEPETMFRESLLPQRILEPA